MTPFVWFQGHIGWPLFGIIVFSAVLLLATDVVWRRVRTTHRALFSTAALVWLAGVAVAVALYFA